MAFQDELERISRDGNFRKVWSRMKDAIVNNDKLSPESKLVVAKLYKEFNSGLSEQLAAFEKSKTTVAATKNAKEAIEIIKEYEAKFEAIKDQIPGVASMALGGLLEGLRKFLSQSLNQIGQDDMPATAKIKELANDAKLHKVWSKVKKTMLENDKLDKEDRKVLKKLYESFDSGLSEVLKKFEKADSDEKAIAYANEAIEIMKDYSAKLKANDDIPGDIYLALSGLLKEMRGFLEGWIEELE